MLDVEAYRRIFLRFQKNTFHFFFVIFLFDPSTINNNAHVRTLRNVTGRIRFSAFTDTGDISVDAH